MPQETPPIQKRWFARLARFAVGPLLVLFLFVGIAMLFETSLIFFPSKYPQGVWDPYGIDFEEVDFKSADGTKLHGWYLPHENPRQVILFCHGNAGNITNRAMPAKRLHDELNASVFVFDYRGYGKSEGRPSEHGVLADARAARSYLVKRENIKPEEVVLLGRSLGGAVAVDLAAKDGAKSLILQSTFTSVPDVATFHYPWLPARWLLRTRLNSLQKIHHYEGPLFQSHGNADTIVPYKLGKQLYDAAPGKKEFMTLQGFDHNAAQNDEYYQALRIFLEENQNTPATTNE